MHKDVQRQRCIITEGEDRLSQCGPLDYITNRYINIISKEKNTCQHQKLFSKKKRNKLAKTDITAVAEARSKADSEVLAVVVVVVVVVVDRLKPEIHCSNI